jgi:hypothetical protein
MNFCQFNDILIFLKFTELALEIIDGRGKLRLFTEGQFIDQYIDGGDIVSNLLCVMLIFADITNKPQ